MSTPTLHPLSKALPKRPEGPMRSPARALGWFSIGLGLTQLLMPRVLSRGVGLQDRPTLVRAYGVREIGVGVGLLTSRDPAPWLWGRVVGDVLDAATVGVGPRSGRHIRTLASLATLAGILAIDAKVASAASKGPRVALKDYSQRSGFPKPAAEMRGAAVNKSQPPVESTLPSVAI